MEMLDGSILLTQQLTQFFTELLDQQMLGLIRMLLAQVEQPLLNSLDLLQLALTKLQSLLRMTLELDQQLTLLTIRQ